MPMYDYKCQSEDCGHEYEKIKKISERENDVCPKCHRLSTRRPSAPKHVNGGFYDLLKKG
ncbi:hypothetical protein [Escherichia phage FL33]|uniref:Putative regulatory protein FmdB zinc ribbon domain-containing protein n=1 Tax=Escherichia phage FL33 TaxID=3128059 RepID=A0AAX4R6Y4_9CAUD